MKVFKISFIVAFFILFTAGSSSAQDLRLTLDAGVSRPAGDLMDQFSWGYSGGGNFLIRITDNLSLGGRIAYNRWGPDEAEFLEDIDPFDIIDAEVEGEARAFEVVPIVRLTTAYPLSPIQFFLHGGAGLYGLSDEVEVNGNDEDGNPVSEIFGDDWRYRFGAQIGAGLLLGSPDYLSLELYPAFHLIFDGNDDTFQYFSINIGLGLGI
ncbi:hypothetical protein QA601_09685 [Chitinispirillales bacterium ANBcel5]|uniref:hypothetical protein n=1 Tax=Cellulosispirillum alkaliphilum TaxID=3039283 RepID=UPI002A579CE7|nr:hypothetical protein [Chitinispirillales bacterium ANBcel5]